MAGTESGVVQEHVSYPKGRSLDREIAAVRNAFPSLASWPLNLPPIPPLVVTPEYDQGDCNPAHKLEYVHHDARNLSDVQASRAWRTSPEFLACARAALPRFCSFVHNVTQPVAEAGAHGVWVP